MIQGRRFTNCLENGFTRDTWMMQGRRFTKSQWPHENRTAASWLKLCSDAVRWFFWGVSLCRVASWPQLSGNAVNWSSSRNNVRTVSWPKLFGNAVSGLYSRCNCDRAVS